MQDEKIEMSTTSDEDQEWRPPYEDVPYVGPREDKRRQETKICNGIGMSFLSMEPPHNIVLPRSFPHYSTSVAAAWFVLGPGRLAEWETRLASCSKVTGLQDPYADHPDVMVCGVLSPAKQWLYKYQDQQNWIERLEQMDYDIIPKQKRIMARREVTRLMEPELSEGIKCMVGRGQSTFDVFKEYIIDQEKLYYPPPLSGDNLYFVDGLYAEILRTKPTEENQEGIDEVYGLNGVVMCKHCKRTAQYSHREGKWYCKLCRQLDYWYKHDDDAINLGQCEQCQNLGIAGYECWYCTPVKEPDFSIEYLKRKFGHQDLKDAPIWWFLSQFSRESLYDDPPLENFIKFMLDHWKETTKWSHLKRWTKLPLDEPYKYMVCNDPNCPSYEKLERALFCRGCGKYFRTAPWSNKKTEFSRKPYYVEENDELVVKWIITGEESWEKQTVHHHSDPYFKSKRMYQDEMFAIQTKFADKIQYALNMTPMPVEFLKEVPIQKEESEENEPKHSTSDSGTPLFVRIKPNVQIPRCILVEDKRRATTFTTRMHKIARPNIPNKYMSNAIYHNGIILRRSHSIQICTQFWTTSDFQTDTQFYIGYPSIQEYKEQQQMWEMYAKRPPFTPRTYNNYDPELEPVIDENGNKIPSDKYKALDALFEKNGGNKNFVSKYAEVTRNLNTNLKRELEDDNKKLDIMEDEGQYDRKPAPKTNTETPPCQRRKAQCNIH